MCFRTAVAFMGSAKPEIPHYLAQWLVGLAHKDWLMMLLAPYKC